VKQLLLRVPEHLHRRLTERAARESRSVNALATEILDAAADSDYRDRRARLRAGAAAAGTLRTVPSPRVTPEQRQQAIDSTRGFGPLIDGILADERERF
jgi:plasmid stability protein